MALFSIQRPFPPTDWQYIWKRKANVYHTLLSKSTYAIFFSDKVQDPSMHYISYFGSVISDLPTTRFSTKKVSFFAFCPLYKSQTLFSTPSPSAVYILTSSTVYYIQVHLNRLHLNTSWKTRHLVFIHITTTKKKKKRKEKTTTIVSTCTQKIYNWYNLQKQWYENSRLITTSVYLPLS